eukprot:CAMPEP_0204913644 /NCGR_PEP_ID=MMETSP1397-20131031/11466_1 /ASSEMBLY_ACC=CAM_ASM_000891 /TAXON_ID=49980 /ORGANISM="Climacostomum Climacostomum virens, Strain Stock W-24" /LENGTH=170 /DNA_ID=CAMNT_0052084915 /DNA_START=787 /DNA_END=1299 /DNA_ORIENTATION=+
MKTFPAAFKFSVSCTTRAPRVGEEHGKEYYFLSPSEFESKIAAQDFLEWAKVHTNYYGTEKAEVVRAQNRVLVLDIDIQGAEQVKRNADVAANFLFVKPPSIADLSRRLEARGTETPETLAIRLKTAARELEFYDKTPEFFGAVVVNSVFEDALREFEGVLGLWYPWVLK